MGDNGGRSLQHMHIDTVLLLMATSKLNQRQGFRFQRTHPALSAGPELTAIGKRAENVPVFYGQSPLDSACSHHVLASIFSILGVIKPSAIVSMNRRKFGYSSVFFKQMLPFWHTGIDSEELVACVNAMGLPITLTARYKTAPDLDQFAIKNLMKGELVAISIDSVFTRSTRHWTLGVAAGGIQRGNTFDTDTLYLLDASASPPVFSEYNAFLKLIPSARKRRSGIGEPSPTKRTPLNWSYCAPDWTPETVMITSAIRFRLVE